METLARFLLSVILWVSGGGTVSLLGMYVLQSLIGTNYNVDFVFGCMWGTAGVICARALLPAPFKNRERD